MQRYVIVASTQALDFRQRAQGIIHSDCGDATKHVPFTGNDVSNKEAYA